VLALLAAVAVCEAVEKAAGIRCGIKWPNDILLRNRKLGGILTELRAELDRTRYCVIGIGLNVNNARTSWSTGRYRSGRLSANRSSARPCSGRYSPASKRVTPHS